MTLTTLAHHIDEVWMREAYRRTRKDAAAGVDGVTAAQYEADLETNLTGLLERFKSGRYRAPAVRRVHLEKPGTSKTRPIGIPTLEDKILQRAVLMVLEPVYEQDFLDCSYGFRPGRGAHQALQALWEERLRWRRHRLRNHVRQRTHDLFGLAGDAHRAQRARCVVVHPRLPVPPPLSAANIAVTLSRSWRQKSTRKRSMTSCSASPSHPARVLSARLYDHERRRPTQIRPGRRHVAETSLRHVTSCTTPLREFLRYFSDLANAWPRLAFEVCAPAQNGTATSANAFCESHTSLKNAFSAAFFSSEALAAFMYSLK